MPNAYERLEVFSIKEILPLIPSEEKVLLAGEKVNCQSKRLRQFKRSTKCAKCKLEGSFFALERAKHGNTKAYHLNLYCEKGTIFTRDHIVPLGKGGRDTMQNSQTLCGPCNWKKADA